MADSVHMFNHGSTATPVMNPPSLPVPQPPALASDVVLAASSRIVRDLDLPQLVLQLQSVGAHLHAASLGTEPFADLHLSVQRAAFLLARLGDKSSAELQSFRHAAGAALDDLECVHALVADGLENAALATLRATRDGFGEIAEGARVLAGEFGNAAGEVQGLLERAVERRGGQVERRLEMEKDMQALGVLLEQARNGKRASEEGFEEAHALYEGALRKEAVAGMKCNAMQVAQVGGVVSGMVSTRPGLHVVGLGGVTALAKTFEAEAIRAREEKAVYLHERHKQRMTRLDMGNEVAEITAKMRSSRKEDQVAQATVDSLEKALSGLRVLSAVMLKACTFWEQIDTTLNRADCVALESAIERSRALSDSEKLELWTSESFMRRAISVYSPWVALQNVCGIYLEKMRGARSSNYELLEAAPTSPTSSEDTNSNRGLQTDQSCKT